MQGFCLILAFFDTLIISQISLNSLHCKDFSIIQQTLLRDTHIAKGVDHTDEEILLFCVGEELNIPLTTMVAHHGEAGSGVFRSVVVQNLSKAPVHLVGFSRLGRESAAAVTFMASDIISSKPLLLIILIAAVYLIFFCIVRVGRN